MKNIFKNLDLPDSCKYFMLEEAVVFIVLSGVVFVVVIDISSLIAIFVIVEIWSCVVSIEFDTLDVKNIFELWVESIFVCVAKSMNLTNLLRGKCLSRGQEEKEKFSCDAHLYKNTLLS